MNKIKSAAFIKGNKYALLFLFFALAGWLVSQSKMQLHEPAEVAYAFNQQLIEKEHQAEQWMDTLFKQIENNTLHSWVNQNSYAIDNWYKDKGLAFYVFKENKLWYWTHNALVLPNDTLWYRTNFQNLGNAWAEVRTRKQNDLLLIALVHVQNSYPYENEYLKNAFHPSFKLKCPMSLTVDSSQDKAIYSKEGAYLFSLQNDKTCEHKSKTRLAIVMLLTALAFGLLFIRDRFKDQKFSVNKFLVFSAVLIVLRAIMQLLQLPSFLGTLPVFQPQYFAFSALFPSLGDLLITISLLVYLLFVFYAKVELVPAKNLPARQASLTGWFWLLLIAAYTVLVHTLFHHLLIDSNFHYEAYDILNLSVFSLIGYFILMTLFIGLVLLLDKAANQLQGQVSPARWLQRMLLILALAVPILYVFNQKEALVPAFFFALMIVFWYWIRQKYNPRFGMVIVLIALFSAYATYFIRVQNHSKRIEESKVLAVNLAREQDPVAEVIIGEMLQTLHSDSTLVDILQEEWFDFEKLIQYLNSNYFTGYLGRYNFQLTLCNPTDSVLLEGSDERWAHCHSFFDTLISKNGTKTAIPGLYHLKNRIGGINYFVETTVHLKNGWEDVTLFIELLSKPNFEVLGYPELLLEKPLGLYNSYTELSFAKYINNQLVEHSGGYPYALDQSVYQQNPDEFSVFQEQDYDHLLYRSGQNAVLVSFPTVKFYNVVISFTYIFLFLLFLVTVLLILGNRFTPIIDFQFNIRNKIVYSLITLLLVSLIIIGGATVFYTYQQYERTQNDLLAEKMQSVLIEIEHKLSNINTIEEVDEDYLASLLVKFSNVFYTDINLYDTKGYLISTSRNEIFEKKLTSPKMHATAYREMVINKKARVVHKERIGKLEYYSAYLPFVGADRKLLAYINLPYFTKEVVFRQELLRVVVAVINIYAFLIMLGIAIAIYMSNRITEPLRMLQNRISKIDLSKKNERINYRGNDEIAQLVYEYNRMLDALDSSAKLLAKSERESAWREMARQIAHEIKNPLTPMKLSTQLLERSWINRDADFEQRLTRFTSNLIEQIDSLSAIASAFSQFAQMTQPRTEKVNLVERLMQSTQLFKECSYVEVDFDFDTHEAIYIKADNERMLQVFNNLIKNAIQAIPQSKQGKVHLKISQENKQVLVAINDNGVGISKEFENNMFQPNFTTKSSGTGLGLAIVKNIVEEFGGSIWFESEYGKGTTFFVSFPVLENDTRTDS
ncbi:MAG: ATP-binding protein [Salinivirgaceae bacterium]